MPFETNNFVLRYDFFVLAATLQKTVNFLSSLLTMASRGRVVNKKTIFLVKNILVAEIAAS